MKTVKERLRSPIVWSAILAQILIIIGLFIPGIADTIKIVATSVIEILTIVGILNNPSDRKNF